MGDSADDLSFDDGDLGRIESFDRENLGNAFLRNAGKRIRIYHASSLTNPSHDPAQLHDEDAFQIVCSCLEQHGCTLEIYEPGLHTAPRSSHSPEDVYLIDEMSVATADLIVLHVNSPSHGVGEEAQIATDVAIPRIILRHEDARVSAMCEGLFSMPADSQAAKRQGLAQATR